MKKLVVVVCSTIAGLAISGCSTPEPEPPSTFAIHNTTDWPATVVVEVVPRGCGGSPREQFYNDCEDLEIQDPQEVVMEPGATSELNFDLESYNFVSLTYSGATDEVPSGFETNLLHEEFINTAQTSFPIAFDLSIVEDDGWVRLDGTYTYASGIVFMLTTGEYDYPPEVCEELNVGCR